MPGFARKTHQGRIAPGSTMFVLTFALVAVAFGHPAIAGDARTGVGNLKKSQAVKGLKENQGAKQLKDRRHVLRHGVRQDPRTGDMTPNWRRAK